MRISDWSSDVCSSDLWYGYDRSDLDIANVNDVALTPDPTLGGTTYPIANRWWIDDRQRNHYAGANLTQRLGRVTLDAALDWTYSRGTTGYRYNSPGVLTQPALDPLLTGEFQPMIYRTTALTVGLTIPLHRRVNLRSEEHTSELQSLMRISYAVSCLKK